MKLIRRVLANIVALIFLANATSAQINAPNIENMLSSDAAIKFNHPSLIKKFYQLCHQQLFWFAPGNPSRPLRLALKNIIDSSANVGLDKNKYHFYELSKGTHDFLQPVDSLTLSKADIVFTDAAIAYCKDAYQGAGISSLISSDEISPKQAEDDDSYILNKLCQVKSDTAFLQLIDSLEPRNIEYQLLKEALSEQLQKQSIDTMKQLA